jgi:hypothetical protein
VGAAMRKLRDQNADKRMQSIEIPLLQFDDDEFYPDPVPDIQPSLPLLNPGLKPDEISKLNPVSISEDGTKDFVEPNHKIQAKLECKLTCQPETATPDVEREEVNPTHEWKVANLQLQLDGHLSRSNCHHPQSKDAMEIDFQVQPGSPCPPSPQPNPESENVLASQFETNSGIGLPVCSHQPQVQPVGDLHVQIEHEHHASQCGLYELEPDPQSESECTGNCEVEPHNEPAISRIEVNSKQLQVQSKFHTFSKLSRFQCDFQNEEQFLVEVIPKREVHIENQILADAVTLQSGAALETEPGSSTCCKFQAVSDTSPERGHDSDVVSPPYNAQTTPLLVREEDHNSAQEQTSKPKLQVEIKVDSKFDAQNKPDLQSQMDLFMNCGANHEVTCDQFLQLQFSLKHQTQITPANEPDHNSGDTIEQELVQHTRSENSAGINVELFSQQNIGVIQKWESLPPTSTDLHISDKPGHPFKGQPEAAKPSHEPQSLRESDAQRNSLFPLSFITPEAVYQINPVFEFDPKVQKSPDLEFDLTQTQLNPVFELDTEDQPKCDLDGVPLPHLKNGDRDESGLTAEGECTPDSKPDRSTDLPHLDLHKYHILDPESNGNIQGEEEEFCEGKMASDISFLSRCLSLDTE